VGTFWLPGYEFAAGRVEANLELSLGLAIAVFAVAAVVIATAGVRMTAIADRLADRTGLGEALTGGLLLGMSTSLSGTVTSVTAAAGGHASLAVSNAIGGIAVQTVFLVVADIVYRRANLERAGPDVRHLLQTALLILMLALALGAYLAPDIALFAIHPVSVILFCVYLGGMTMAGRLSRQPTWEPQSSPDMRLDQPEKDAHKLPLPNLMLTFSGLALVLALAGYAIAESGTIIAARAGISQTILGALLTATITSLPELVTTLAAIRRNALQLAIGGIVGGNTFDILFLPLSDLAYRDGSIYEAILARDALLIVAAIVMSAILLLGLIVRHSKSIGFEGYAILATYVVLVAMQIGWG